MKKKLDIYGNPIIPIPKCKNCGREKDDHKAETLNCPASRHKFTWFYPNQFYEPKGTSK
jgi:hypothetical protein